MRLASVSQGRKQCQDKVLCTNLARDRFSIWIPLAGRVHPDINWPERAIVNGSRVSVGETLVDGRNVKPQTGNDFGAT